MRNLAWFANKFWNIQIKFDLIATKRINDQIECEESNQKEVEVQWHLYLL